MGRFEAQIQGFEVLANNDLFVTYGVRVVSYDGTTVRGTTSLGDTGLSE